MITLTKFPPNNIAFADMPMEVKYARKGVFTTKGDFATAQFKVDHSHYPALASTLIFTWNGGTSTVNFQFALFIPPIAPESTTQLPVLFPSGPMEDYCKILARSINEHEAFSQNYLCEFLVVDTSGDGILQIQAKERGTAYSFSITGTSGLTTLSGTTPITGTGINAVSFKSMRLRALAKTHSRIWQESEESTYNLNASGEIVYEENTAKYSFHEIHKTVQSELDIDLPHVAFHPFMQHAAVATIDAEIYEVNDGVQKRSKTMPELTVLSGGVPLSHVTEDNISEFTTQNGMRFLTQMPREKIIFPDQPEWLSFLVSNSEYNIEVKFIVHYSNGQTATKSFTSFVKERFPAVFCVPTGYNNAGLKALENGRKAAYYTVQLLLASGVVSELRTYILDYGYAKIKRYFIVRNSLNGFDTFRAIGNATYTPQYSRNQYALAATERSRLHIGTVRSSYNEESQSYTIRTGYVPDKDELDLWRQLLITKDVWLLAAPLVFDEGSGNLYQPFLQPFARVIVEGDSFEMYTENDGKQGLEWKFKLANSDIHFGGKDFYKMPPKYTDSDVRMLISVNSISGVPGIMVTTTANLSKIYVNGELKAIGANASISIAPEYGNVYDIQIQAFNLTRIVCNHNDHNAVHTFQRISSADLKEIRLFNVREIDIAYLAPRVETLYSIKTLELTTKTPGDWGSARTNKMLLACKKLVDSGRALNFTTLSVNSTGGGGTPLGLALKSYLVNLGKSIYA